MGHPVALCFLSSVHELSDTALCDELDQGAAIGPVLSLGPPLHQIGDELQFRPRCLVWNNLPRVTI